MKRADQITRLIALADLIALRESAEAARAQNACQVIEARIASHRALLVQAERALDDHAGSLELAQAQLRFAQVQSRALQASLRQLALAEVTRISTREMAAKALGRREVLEKLARKAKS